MIGYFIMITLLAVGFVISTNPVSYIAGQARRKKIGIEYNFFPSRKTYLEHHVLSLNDRIGDKNMKPAIVLCVGMFLIEIYALVDIAEILGINALSDNDYSYPYGTAIFFISVISIIPIIQATMLKLGFSEEKPEKNILTGSLLPLGSLGISMFFCIFLEDNGLRISIAEKVSLLPVILYFGYFAMCWLSKENTHVKEKGNNHMFKNPYNNN